MLACIGMHCNESIGYGKPVNGERITGIQGEGIFLA